MLPDFLEKEVQVAAVPFEPLSLTLQLWGTGGLRRNESPSLGPDSINLKKLNITQSG